MIMNEQQWVACGDPRRMLDLLNVGGESVSYGYVKIGRPSDRKLRMFVVAMALSYHRHADDSYSRDYEWIDGNGPAPEPSPRRWELYDLSPIEAATRSIEHFTKAGIKPVRFMTPAGLAGNRRRLPLSVSCDIIRDIIGNPYKQIIINHAWLTTDILSLAEAAYSELSNAGHLDHARLTVLADALEEAGADEAISSHLRSPGPHWRGCHVIDALTGRK